MRSFDFNLQIKKFNAAIEKNSSTVITADGFFNAVTRIAKNNAGCKYTVVSLESDFLKFGGEVTAALSDCNAEYSVYLINADDLNFEKPEEIFSISDSETIIIGGKDLISYVLFYASKNGNCHALLTEPYVEGLLGGKVTVPDGKFFKSVDVITLKTVVLDKNVISKANGNKIAYAYVKCVGKSIFLIDYKLAVLSGKKVLDKTRYDMARLAVTLISALNTFKNPIDVITYCSVVTAEVLARSDVLSCGGNDLIARVIELTENTINKGDVAILAFLQAAKIYHAFFVNDFTDLVSVADYNGDVALLSKISGKSERYFYNLLKIPSAERKKLLAKLINLTRSDFVKQTSDVLRAAEVIKNNYYNLKKDKESQVNYKYALVKEAVKLSTYLTSETSVLTLCRDFGFLNLAK